MVLIKTILISHVAQVVTQPNENINSHWDKLISKTLWANFANASN
jgi:hypothetical protein